MCMLYGEAYGICDLEFGEELGLVVKLHRL